MPKHAVIPPGDRDEAERLRGVLTGLRSTGVLPGISDDHCRDVLVAQLIESQRRRRYIARLRELDLSPAALDGAGGSFDPLKAAILKSREGEHDEACWLVLLSVHFGRNRKSGWQLAGDFYGQLGQGATWDWPSTSDDVVGMRGWLDANLGALRARGGHFGNHRKYQSLDPWTSTGTGQVLASYVEWVGAGTHSERFAQASVAATTPRERFAALCRSVAAVTGFGRVAQFDYVTMLGKIGLVDVDADCAHLTGATGPLAGARLLLDGSASSTCSAASLEVRLSPVQQTLGVPFDVLEDAICNWQKSPSDFVPFRG